MIRLGTGGIHKGVAGIVAEKLESLFPLFQRRLQGIGGLGGMRRPWRWLRRKGYLGIGEADSVIQVGKVQLKGTTNILRIGHLLGRNSVKAHAYHGQSHPMRP